MSFKGLISVYIPRNNTISGHQLEYVKKKCDLDIKNVTSKKPGFRLKKILDLVENYDGDNEEKKNTITYIKEKIAPSRRQQLKAAYNAKASTTQDGKNSVYVDEVQKLKDKISQVEELIQRMRTSGVYRKQAEKPLRKKIATLKQEIVKILTDKISQLDKQIDKVIEDDINGKLEALELKSLEFLEEIKIHEKEIVQITTLSKMKASTTQAKIRSISQDGKNSADADKSFSESNEACRYGEPEEEELETIYGEPEEEELETIYEDPINGPIDDLKHQLSKIAIRIGRESDKGKVERKAKRAEKAAIEAKKRAGAGQKEAEAAGRRARQNAEKRENKKAEKNLTSLRQEQETLENKLKELKELKELKDAKLNSPVTKDPHTELKHKKVILKASTTKDQVEKVRSAESPEIHKSEKPEEEELGPKAKLHNMIRKRNEMKREKNEIKSKLTDGSPREEAEKEKLENKLEELRSKLKATKSTENELRDEVYALIPAQPPT